MGETSNNPYAAHKGLHNSIHEVLYGLLMAFRESGDRGLDCDPDKFAKFKSHLYVHMIWEEKMLFSRLESKTKEATVTSILRKQDLQLKKLVGYIEKELRKKEARTTDSIYVKELEELLKAHNKLEEEQLFPLIDKYIGEDELNSALLVFQEID